MDDKEFGRRKLAEIKRMLRMRDRPPKEEKPVVAGGLIDTLNKVIGPAMTKALIK